MIGEKHFFGLKIIAQQISIHRGGEKVNRNHLT